MIHYGNNHVFTSRDTSENITLKAGVNEKLTFGSAPFTAETDMNLFGGTSYVTSNSALTSYLGISISVVESGSNAYVGAGAPLDSDAGIDNGALAIFKSTAGAGAFIEQQLLQSGYTTDGGYARYSSMDLDTTLATYSGIYDNGTRQVVIFRRSASTWTEIADQGSVLLTTVACKTDGAYAIISGSGSRGVDILHDAGSDVWSVQQASLSATVDLTLLDISGSNCTFYDGTNVKVFSRSGTTWTQSKSIAIASVLSLCLRGNFLCFSTASNTYIYYYSTSWTLIQTISGTGVICSAITSTGQLAIGRTYYVDIYTNISNVFTLTMSSSSPAVSAISISETMIAVGHSTLISGNGTISIYRYAVTGENIPSVTITGNLSVSGKIIGSQASNLIRLVENTYTQTIPNNTNTALSTVFLYSNPVVEETVDYAFATGVSTILVEGEYLMLAQLSYAASATGYRTLTIRKNDNMVGKTSQGGFASVDNYLQTTAHIYLIVGDQINVTTTQTSGGDLVCTSGMFSISKIK